VPADQALGRAATLKLADLPAGGQWTGTPHDNSGSSGGTPDNSSLDIKTAQCLGVPVGDLNTNDPASVSSDDFSDNKHDLISNDVIYLATAAVAHRQFAVFTGAGVPKCLGSVFGPIFQDQANDPSNSLPPGFTVGSPEVVSLPLPQLGDESIGYRVTIRISGTVKGKPLVIPGYLDFLLARKGRAGVNMEFAGFANPLPVSQEQHDMTLVLSRLDQT
jgi:hypothetical protein